MSGLEGLKLKYLSTVLDYTSYSGSYRFNSFNRLMGLFRCERGEVERSFVDAVERWSWRCENGGRVFAEQGRERSAGVG